MALSRIATYGDACQAYPASIQVSQRLAVMVLQGYGTNLAQIHAQPGQLIIRRRHFAFANEYDVLQRQKASQSGMIAEGCELGRVGRPGASAARPDCLQPLLRFSGSVAARHRLLSAGLAGGWRASAMGVVPDGAGGGWEAPVHVKSGFIFNGPVKG